jgi:hypothetical protein
MREETQKKCEEVDSLTTGDNPIPVSQALKQAKLGPQTYYTWKKNGTTTSPAKPKYVDIVTNAAPAGKVAVVVCRTDQLKNVLEELT